MIRQKLLSIAAFSLAVAAAPLQAAELAGHWLKFSDDGKNAVIEIYKEGDSYDGKIVKLEQPLFTAADGAELAGKPKTDRHNPDEAVRTRQIEGLKIIRGFKADSDRAWSGATIYNPEDGKTYKCKATLSPDGGTLEVRGYVGVSLLGKTQVWKRLQSAEFPAKK